MEKENKKPILLLATENVGKFRELSAMILAHGYWQPMMASRWPSGFIGYPPENGQSFADNARIKSEAVATATGQWTLADDSGLSVLNLDGKPGIHSARFGLPEMDDRQRCEYLLDQLISQKFKDDRRAFFQAVLSLSGPNGKEIINFTGRLDGHISDGLRGSHGFGYDPIFIPLGSQRTLAEMLSQEKNAISHRAIALGQFLAFRPS